MSAESPTHADLYHEIGELKRDIGGIKEGLGNVKEDVKAISENVTKLVATDAERRGAAKIMVWAAGIGGGSVSALLTKYLSTGKLF